MWHASFIFLCKLLTIHQSVARAWNALGTISGEKAAILNILSKYPELDETLLKWFWEKKSQDKSKSLLFWITIL